MLRQKAVYSIIAILVLIAPLSVSAIDNDKANPSEEKDAIHSTVDINFSRHEPFERVVLYGSQELINSGKVRHKDNEVIVTFPDAEFSLKEDKVHLSFRREKDRIIFQRDNIERIRVLNLVNPVRLAIDFYTTKTESDQLEAYAVQKNEKEINERVAVVVEKVLQALDNKKQNMEGQKLETSERNRDLASNEVNSKVTAVVRKILYYLDSKDQRMELSEEVSDIEKNEDSVSKESSTRMAEVVDKVLAVLDSTEQKVAGQDPEISGIKSTSAIEIIDLEKEAVAESFDGQDKSVAPEKAEIAAPELQIKKHNERIALLLFDNFSGDHEALDVIMPLILKQLKGRDYDVIDYEEIEEYLCERRIRQSSFISKEVAMELVGDKMVKTAITGSVLTFSTDGNPKIGIVARRLDLRTGHIIWSDFVSLTGEDFTRVLGLGTINSMDMLIPNALNNLFATFENRSLKKDGNAKYKIAVLPFKNVSDHRHAGMIVTHLFQNELANNPMFDPVDYGDIKKSIVNLRVGRKGEVDYNSLKALSKSLGVDVVLTGTVEEYKAGQDYSLPPSVFISARLLDSKRSRIVWYENLQLDGDKNIIALDWGRLRSADKVAYGAVSGLVNNIKAEGLLR